MFECVVSLFGFHGMFSAFVMTMTVGVLLVNYIKTTSAHSALDPSRHSLGYLIAV